MKAREGDQLRFYSRHVDRPDRIAVILKVGAGGEPPYLVRIADGSEVVVVPGSDCVVLPAGDGASHGGDRG
ncbi:MAG TPA: DUF1918 domain-containing protein [Pseudonocardia sp.]|uniref:DUF1918 domain-containing protein n=1 Tax=Pseudonocardia sp. TaxID=60912 RepID=UPI002F4133D8